MTTQTQTSPDGDRYGPKPVVLLGQGDYTYEWPPRPTAQPATIDLDVRPGISDGLFAGLVWMLYGMIVASGGWLAYIWST